MCDLIYSLLGDEQRFTVIHRDTTMQVLSHVITCHVSHVGATRSISNIWLTS